MNPNALSSRYVPENSTAHTLDMLDAIVYSYESKSGKPCAIAYRGKSNKPVFHYLYRDAGERYVKIGAWLKEVQANELARAQFKAEKAAAKKAFRHTFKPGDILYASWGYDQTNVDFFQVISATEKQVTFREIAGETVPGSGGHDCCSVVASPDNFLNDKTYTRTVQYGGQYGGYISFADYPGGYSRHLSAWDGHALYCSWYA